MHDFCIAKSGKKGKKSSKEEEEKKVAEEDHSIKPTRPIGAYIFYSNVNVPKIKEKEGLSHKEAMGKAG